MQLPTPYNFAAILIFFIVTVWLAPAAAFFIFRFWQQRGELEERKEERRWHSRLLRMRRRST